MPWNWLESRSSVQGVKLLCVLWIRLGAPLARSDIFVTVISS